MERWQRIRTSWQRCGALRCPVCGAALHPEERSLLCPNSHRYDIARQSHVDLSAGRASAQYDAALWQARREAVGAGFFAPLTDCVRDILSSVSGLCIDAGCGEGSLTAALFQGSGNPWLGLDLSRDGVKAAAAAYPEQLWAVADLTRAPLADGCAAAVVNLLSPAAYHEFARLLCKGGILVKAVPAPEHLQELRKLWDVPSSPSEAEAVFRRHCQSFRRLNIIQTFSVGKLLPALAAMTPLGWRRGDIPLPPCLDVTLAVTVLWTTKEELVTPA